MAVQAVDKIDEWLGASKKYNNDIGELKKNANVITDDVTHQKFKLGIENGNLYYEEVQG